MQSSLLSTKEKYFIFLWICSTINPVNSLLREDQIINSKWEIRFLRNPCSCFLSQKYTNCLGPSPPLSSTHCAVAEPPAFESAKETKTPGKSKIIDLFPWICLYKFFFFLIFSQVEKSRLAIFRWVNS